MTVRISRVTISVADLPRALALYEGAIGLTRRYADGDIVMLATDVPVTEVLLHRRRPDRGDFTVAATFGVDDVDAVTAAAEAAGAEIVDAASDQPWGERQAVLRDADGHILCLSQPVDAGRTAS